MRGKLELRSARPSSLSPAADLDLADVATLIATVTVSVLVLTISAKLELLELLELLDAEPELEEELLDEEPPDDDPACTESPGNRSSSDTIVPLAGARSVVASKASSSLFTLCSSVSTAISSSSSQHPDSSRHQGQATQVHRLPHRQSIREPSSRIGRGLSELCRNPRARGSC